MTLLLHITHASGCQYYSGNAFSCHIGHCAHACAWLYFTVKQQVVWHVLFWVRHTCLLDCTVAPFFAANPPWGAYYKAAVASIGPVLKQQLSAQAHMYFSTPLRTFLVAVTTAAFPALAPAPAHIQQRTATAADCLLMATPQGGAHYHTMVLPQHAAAALTSASKCVQHMLKSSMPLQLLWRTAQGRQSAHCCCSSGHTCSSCSTACAAPALGAAAWHTQQHQKVNAGFTQRS